MITATHTFEQLHEKALTLEAWAFSFWDTHGNYCTSDEDIAFFGVEFIDGELLTVEYDERFETLTFMLRPSRWDA